MGALEQSSSDLIAFVQQYFTSDRAFLGFVDIQKLKKEPYFLLGFYKPSEDGVSQHFLPFKFYDGRYQINLKKGDQMKKHSMLIGAFCMILINLYGLLVSAILQPITPSILATSIIMIITLVYVQFNKRRILLDGYRRESYFLFVLLIMEAIYMTVAGFLVLVYLNEYQHSKGNVKLDLSGMIVGLHTLPTNEAQSLTLPYYFANFLFFIYYLRCYFIMFWSQNMIFIFRYLKAHVKHLNQTLLANLPKVQVTEQMKESICALCLENYQSEEDVTKLKCQHIYHLDCIKIWVVRSNCCPLCRKKVVYY